MMCRIASDQDLKNGLGRGSPFPSSLGFKTKIEPKIGYGKDWLSLLRSSISCIRIMIANLPGVKLEKAQRTLRRRPKMQKSKGGC
jgi:hypothetical protein